MSSAKFYRLAGKEINNLVKSLGFKKYQRFFYRITEDGVVQQFCLLWLYRSFTIRFQLSSIYSDNDRTCEGVEVYQIINGSNEWVSEKFGDDFFSVLTDGGYMSAAQGCKKVLEETLLPYFEKTSNLESAHQFVMEHNSLVKAGIREFDPREIGFYLALKEYDKAKEVLEYFIKHKDRWNKKWWSRKEKEYQDLYTAICKKDMDFIEAFKNRKRRDTYMEFKLCDI